MVWLRDITLSRRCSHLVSVHLRLTSYLSLIQVQAMLVAVTTLGLYLTSGISSKAAVDCFGGVCDTIMSKFVECISILYCRQRTVNPILYSRRQPLIMLCMKKPILRTQTCVFRERRI